MPGPPPRTLCPTAPEAQAMPWPRLRCICTVLGVVPYWPSDLNLRPASSLRAALVTTGLRAYPGYCHQTCSAVGVSSRWDPCPACWAATLSPRLPALAEVLPTPAAPWHPWEIIKANLLRLETTQFSRFINSFKWFTQDNKWYLWPNRKTQSELLHLKL